MPVIEHCISERCSNIPATKPQEDHLWNRSLYTPDLKLGKVVQLNLHPKTH